MILKLKRTTFTSESTSGELYIDDVFFCYTLEDRVRLGDIFKVKVPHETAIPADTYGVIIDESTRFARRMPHILNVPNFDGIRIHSGNTASDTEGCVLIGVVVGRNFVGHSRKAFDEFFPRLDKALSGGEKVMITISNEGAPFTDEIPA